MCFSSGRCRDFLLSWARSTAEEPGQQQSCEWEATSWSLDDYLWSIMIFWCMNIDQISKKIIQRFVHLSLWKITTEVEIFIFHFKNTDYDVYSWHQKFYSWFSSLNSTYYSLDSSTDCWVFKISENVHPATFRGETLGSASRSRTLVCGREAGLVIKGRHALPVRHTQSVHDESSNSSH